MKHKASIGFLIILLIGLCPFIKFYYDTRADQYVLERPKILEYALAKLVGVPLAVYSLLWTLYKLYGRVREHFASKREEIEDLRDHIRKLEETTPKVKYEYPRPQEWECSYCGQLNAPNRLRCYKCRKYR